ELKDSPMMGGRETALAGVRGTMQRGGRSFRCYHEGEAAISPLMCN
ncbi:hypothetical protein A2U01_0047138, partial [Trifolium medium]|nr:hypothetical protein [Trifolium medium]